MRSEAYRLTGFTVVASAGGFLLRWLQNIRIIDPETGLATRGMAISVIMALALAAVAGGIGAICFILRRCEAPTVPTQALAGKSFLHTALGLLPILLLAVSGLVQLVQVGTGYWGESLIGVRRVCAVGTLLGALGLALVASGVSRQEKESTVRIGMVMLIIFGGLWLIAIYKSAASDPVVWRFAVEVLAVCAAILAFYYVAGYYFGEPNPVLAIFFCHLGGFLCLVAVIDEHTAGESICCAAVALLLLYWGFTLTSNLRRPTEPEAHAEG